MKHNPTTRRAFALSYLALAAFGLSSFATVSAADQPVPKPDGKPADTWTKPVDKIVLILGSYTDFHEAQSQALAISRRAKTPFSMRGMLYDKKRGLIHPENDSNSPDAGSYILRRYNTTRLRGSDEESEYISIERSDAYPGFAPHIYIIVGGIYNNNKQASAALVRFKPLIPDVYTKKTKIYMGCMH